ncbi:uncharacterized protein LOC114770642 [Denticeps clupeoides]|uniref:uncharacterized protein LOC114770642 n=1 Tax=Denticeps clupeoides TaxID=299321 RepID=UPI0010A532AF|nr:uncharacterized protein LOC114770642 [Denticeps clupeoides]
MLSIYVLKDFFISYAMLNLSLKWIMIFAMSSNMASSVFLNVFYFCQIVPARHAFSIWMKRNLKTITTVTRPTILSALMYFEMFFAVFAFWAMTLSSLSTVDYLRRHISSMGAVGISSSPHLRSQIRVTVIGIIQGGLFSLCSLWIVVNICFFQKTVSTFDPNNHILVTVFTLYSFGTTINLGVGQAVLRQRVSNMLVNVKKAFH